MFLYWYISLYACFTILWRSIADWLYGTLYYYLGCLVCHKKITKSSVSRPPLLYRYNITIFTFSLHMNFQVPSYPLAIRTGSSLFSLKIQRILRIFWSEAVYLILFGINSFKCIFNDRICFPHVQTIRLAPKKTTF